MEQPINKQLKPRVSSFDSEDVLGSFFEALADNDIRALVSMHIPRSDVFYVREKYYQDTGHWVSLDRMERAMYLEGLLSESDVKDPYVKRDWE